jgi:23S rRNA-/tRNA-specific pseudouridylate synthase
MKTSRPFINIIRKTFILIKSLIFLSELSTAFPSSPLPFHQINTYHVDLHRKHLCLPSPLLAYNYELLQPISDSSSSSSPLPSELLQQNISEIEGDYDEDGVVMNNINEYDTKEEHDLFCEFPSDEDLELLPKGSKGGHKVLYQYQVSKECCFDDEIRNEKNEGTSKSNISSISTTIQKALVQLDPEKFTSLSKSRKACRKGSILIHQGPIQNTSTNADDDDNKHNDILNAFGINSKKSSRARVGDLVHPGDVIGVQIMMGTFRKKRSYPYITYSRPQYKLPVLYEDDYMAIVDKPAGIGMYGKRQKQSGPGTNFSRRTIRDALPYCLTPPRKGSWGVPLMRPTAVHRLDTPTSGLVVIAKTREARQCLSQQFAERRAMKTYTAIVNGIPVADDSDDENININRRRKNNDWNIVDYPLGNKHAITQWKTLRSAESLNAKDGILTLVSVKPLTGRYHQIRRHMAWICRRPLVGDHIYAGQLQAPRFLRNGLYLCSNGITLEHPYYNSSRGKIDWNIMMESKNREEGGERKPLDKHLSFHDGKVMITVEKELPKRFQKLLNGEEIWAKRKMNQG